MVNIKQEGYPLYPDIIEEHSVGGMISYIPTADYLKNAEKEIEAVENCGCSPFSSADDLIQAMGEDRTDIAVFHIASHGTFDPDSIGKAAVNVPEENECSELMLNCSSMKLIRKSKPVVFINACHSAREGRLGWGVSGVNIPFLRNGAKGFIGVMGRVRSKSAANISKKIFEAIQQENPESVAEILRKIRKEAVVMAQNFSPENQKYVLDAFMYIYYGSPINSVRILLPDQGDQQCKICP